MSSPGDVNDANDVNDAEGPSAAMRQRDVGRYGVCRYYVYYRVPEHALAAVAQAVRGLHAGHGGQPFELLRRPGSDAGLATVMEVYGPLDAARAAALEAEAAVALAGWLHGSRHVETFEPLTD